MTDEKVGNPDTMLSKEEYQDAITRRVANAPEPDDERMIRMYERAGGVRPLDTDEQSGDVDVATPDPRDKQATARHDELAARREQSADAGQSAAADQGSKVHDGEGVHEWDGPNTQTSSESTQSSSAKNANAGQSSARTTGKTSKSR